MTESWRKTLEDYDENARSYFLVRHTLLLLHRPHTDLILKGSGESGKSTIVKQMKIIHQNGYTVEELALYRLTIYKNLLDCMKALIGAMRQFEVEPADPKNKEYSDYIMEYTVDPDPHTPLDSKVGDAVTSIWNDGNKPAIMEHQSEFYLMDSAP